MIPDLVDSFVEGLNNKNITLAHHSIDFLTLAIKSADASFFSSSHDSVRTLLKQLVQELDGKRAKTKKGAETIFTEIKTKTSQE